MLPGACLCKMQSVTRGSSQCRVDALTVPSCALNLRRLQEGSLALHAQVSTLEQNLAYKADKVPTDHPAKETNRTAAT